MTKRFKQMVHCPKCGYEHTVEQGFGRWIRDVETMDSKRDGFYVMDSDYWIYKWKTCRNKSYQCIMLVELKTRGKKPDDAQRSCMHMINQLMRNRKQYPAIKLQAGTGLTKLYSIMNRKRVNVKSFGVHTLCLSGTSPDNSSEILWDNKRIDVNKLVSLLRFDTDPDSLNPYYLEWDKEKPDEYMFLSDGGEL